MIRMKKDNIYLTNRDYKGKGKKSCCLVKEEDTKYETTDQDDGEEDT